MSSASHQQRDLAIGRHAVMAEAFELLSDHLGPFIDERMGQYFEDEVAWVEEAANRLGRPTEHGATDPLFLLLVLRRFWGPVFADFYGQDLRKIVAQLIDTRNKWAHFSFPSDPSALQRSMLAIERLVAPVEPDAAVRLRQLRAKVIDQDGGGPVADDQTNAGTPGSDPDDADHTVGPGSLDTEDDGARTPDRVDPEPSKPDATRPDVGDPDGPGHDPTGERVDVLLNQLTETESVFHELQNRYGDLLDELNNTRRITATKQLRLTAMERRLVEVEDHSATVLEDLKEERTSRQNIEWLIVVLLATLLLFMLLASAT